MQGVIMTFHPTITSRADLDVAANVQDGVVSRAQALTVLTPGQLRWLLHRGTWRQLHPGVYATHSGEVSWAARCQAALLYFGEGAALSRESAAYLLRIERDQPPMVHVDLPHNTAAATLTRVHVRRRRRLETIERGGLTITEPAFTVIDLAGQRWASRQDAVAVVARAVQRKATTVPRLVEELSRRRSHRHRRPLELALGAVGEGAESGLEVTYLEDVVRKHGLPPMRLNIPDTIAGAAVRRDFTNEEFGVVAEVDGMLGHEGDGRVKDARRDRKTLATGRVTARQTWVEVHYGPCELAADLFGIYRTRGYRGGIILCGPACTVRRHLADLGLV